MAPQIVASPVLLFGEVIDAPHDRLGRKETIMDAQLDEQQAVGAEWIVIEEEDWPGVNDCGAIFVPDGEMKFEIDDEDWLISNQC
ncbi:MAG TPA: hypothetical protein VLG46_10970 [Anaerolineae bacterium]|nr:hypothetical protein [Anaerolineae bacterium]